MIERRDTSAEPKKPMSRRKTLPIRLEVVLLLVLSDWREERESDEAGIENVLFEQGLGAELKLTESGPKKLEPLPYLTLSYHP